MIKAQILTSWTIDEQGANTPHFPFMVIGDSWTDVTATPAANLEPVPNVIVIECTLSDDTYQVVLDDSDFSIGSIFWSEEIIEDVPTY